MLVTLLLKMETPVNHRLHLPKLTLLYKPVALNL